VITFFFLIVSIVLVIVLVVLLKTLNRYNETFRQRSLWRKWPILKKEISELDETFHPGTQGPSKKTEIHFISHYCVPGGISDFETWILCNLAKKSLSVFEFGTFTGKTTYLLAKNSPEAAKITTLTLHPDALSLYTNHETDDKKDSLAAIKESICDRFYYTDDVVSTKIIQLFEDSKQFDETPYAESMDLIFVDGSHAKSYVESDSQKALRMVRPGGYVVWHDYRGPNRARGVYETLNALNRQLDLVHIKNTSFVIYKHISS